MSKKEQYKQKLLERREIALMQVQMELDILFSKEKTNQLLKLGNNKFYQSLERMRVRAKK